MACKVGPEKLAQRGKIGLFKRSRECRPVCWTMRDAERGEVPEAEKPRQDTKTGASRVRRTTRATAWTQESRRIVRNEVGGPARRRDVNESVNKHQVDKEPCGDAGGDPA